MTNPPTTALVTGATSGIGRATAVQLAAQGIHVVVAGRNAERGHEVVAQIRAANGRADFLEADLHNEETAKRAAAEAVVLAGGRIDILVNSAGIFPFGPTAETTEEVFDAVFDTNVKAAYFLVAALAPLMAERGAGAIVNITTMVAEFGANGMALYGASKAALGLLTKSWAAEFGPKGVRVNAVGPGPTRTEGTAVMGDALDAQATLGPAGRPGTADEIANAIVFLATDASSFIHGAILPVDGGRIAV
ncbi:SDR family NAD(P)-dependent oxidoreductase [Plantibacter sp. Mn2098]|uniref:SDR family NAD(P)-dependent oxidoreductase n=1 Tax=Plantibacter sp. Mn2098 TaxID=3395266 RepID=UPI003BD1A0BA